MDQTVFLDTSYILALILKDDTFYNQAKTISELLETGTINVTTTELVLIEIADSLAKIKVRHKCIPIITKLRTTINVTKINDESLFKAWDLFDKRIDKEWGLTDCYSFVVMEKYGIKQALTTDKHFEQVDFEILLK
jgi:uncharacterized protein